MRPPPPHTHLHAHAHMPMQHTLNRIAGADIKDKQPLIDARKSIERDMERFKACEKEAKMKGGAGGVGANRNDPKEKAR